MTEHNANEFDRIDLVLLPLLFFGGGLAVTYGLTWQIDQALGPSTTSAFIGLGAGVVAAIFGPTIYLWVRGYDVRSYYD